MHIDTSSEYQRTTLFTMGPIAIHVMFCVVYPSCGTTAPFPCLSHMKSHDCA